MTDIKEAQGLEVVAWQDAENQLYTTGEKRQMHGWATDGYPIVELVRLSDATAVIDQLKAENEVLTLRVMAGERQELAAIMEQSTVRAERILRLEDELAKLYASPATKAVVMPNRMTDGAADYAYARYSAGWNACLDEFARLNRSNTNEQ